MGKLRLSVSIFEARNIQADGGSAPEFYVKVKLNGKEMQTKTLRDLNPKFREELRMDLEEDDDILIIELLQVGPKGDLIIGSEDVNLAELRSKGTFTPQRLVQLKDAADRPTATLMMVLRIGDPSAAAPSARGEAPATSRRKPKKGGNPVLGLVGAMGGLATGVVGGVLSIIPGLGGKKEPKAATTRTPRSARTAPPTPTAASAAAAAASAPASGTTTPVTTARPSKRSSGGRSGVPIPLLIVVGAAVGLVGYQATRKEVFYEIQEGDTLCDIAGCYNVHYWDIYERNKGTITNPDIIYPGDKIRVR